MSSTSWNEFNNRVIEEFRAKHGKVKGPEGGDLILLNTKGAKTGQPRTYPLMSVPYGENYLAVASKGGAPSNPHWYYNLLAHPDVTVETGAETFPAKARLLTGEERDKAYAHAASIFAPYAEYQQKTTRVIPVFLLELQKNK